MNKSYYRGVKKEEHFQANKAAQEFGMRVWEYAHQRCICESQS